MATPTTAAPAARISFSVTPEDARLIGRIVDRYAEMRRGFGIRTNKADLVEMHMDLTATHANGTPLKLAALLAAGDFNFSHDVGGIRKHIDRRTGKLTGCFVPRFAAEGR